MSGRDKLGTREQGDAGRVGCAVRWTESLLRRSVEQLFRQALDHEDRDLDGSDGPLLPARSGCVPERYSVVSQIARPAITDCLTYPGT